MAYKGTAAKSSSGAAMSKYDVEVEARLQALEAKAHTPCGGSGGVSEERIAALEARIEALYIVMICRASTVPCESEVDPLFRNAACNLEPNLLPTSLPSSNDNARVRVQTSILVSPGRCWLMLASDPPFRLAGKSIIERTTLHLSILLQVKALEFSKKG